MEISEVLERHRFEMASTRSIFCFSGLVEEKGSTFFVGADFLRCLFGCLKKQCMQGGTSKLYVFETC